MYYTRISTRTTSIIIIIIVLVLYIRHESNNGTRELMFPQIQYCSEIKREQLWRLNIIIIASPQPSRSSATGSGGIPIKLYDFAIRYWTFDCLIVIIFIKLSFQTTSTSRSEDSYRTSAIIGHNILIVITARV